MGLLSNALDALFKKRTNAASLSGAMVPIVTNVGTAGNPQYAIAGIDSMPNLASVLGGQYKNIQENDDLNDEKFRVCGNVYVCNSSAIGKTLVNTPDDGNFGAFRLEIVPCAGTVFPMHRIYYASKASPKVYVRYYESGWGTWKQLAFAG